MLQTYTPLFMTVGASGHTCISAHSTKGQPLFEKTDYVMKLTVLYTFNYKLREFYVCSDLGDVRIIDLLPQRAVTNSCRTYFVKNTTYSEMSQVQVACIQINLVTPIQI
jgi:hypothetical protein